MAITERTFRLSGLEEPYEVVVADVDEGLSMPTRAKVRLRLELTQTLDAEAALGKDVVLEMLEDDAPVRAFHLVVQGVLDEGEAVQEHFFELDLLDRFGMLELRKDLRIFQEKTSVDIVKLVFERAGIDVGTCDFQASRTLPKRVYCVQYRETDRDFSERLMDFEGIGRSRPTSPTRPRRSSRTTRRSSSRSRASTCCRTSTADRDRGLRPRGHPLVITEEVVLRATTTRRRGWTSPRRPGSPAPSPRGTSSRAATRRRRTARRSRRSGSRSTSLSARWPRGSHTSRRLRPGRTFDLTETTRDALNVTWLVRAVTHRYRRTGGEKNQVYECARSRRALPTRPTGRSGGTSGRWCRAPTRSR